MEQAGLEQVAGSLDEKSAELLEKWKKQAAILRAQHPKWNAEKVQEEMKKKILNQAKTAIPEMKHEDYRKKLEEWNNRDTYRQEVISKIMAHLGGKSPDAVGVALFDLDCGCLRACAVSSDGDPMGEMVMVVTKSAEEGDASACAACDADGGGDLKRISGKAMVWPGSETEMPDEASRLAIGKKVFGDDYSPDDI